MTSRRPLYLKEAPSIPVVLVGWCIAQLFFNALLAAMVAVVPDQVPSIQRGQVSGVLGVSQPIGSVCGAFLVKLFTGSLLAMFLARRIHRPLVGAKQPPRRRSPASSMCR